MIDKRLRGWMSGRSRVYMIVNVRGCTRDRSR